MNGIHRLLLASGIFLLTTGVILFLHTATIFYFLIALSSLVLLSFFHKKTDLIPYILAGFLGGLGENQMVASGVWKYAESNIGTIPFYVPLFWGCSFLCIQHIFQSVFSLHDLGENIFDYKRDTKIYNAKNIAIGIITYPIVLFLISSLWKYNVLLGILLLSVMVVHVGIFYRKYDFLLMLGGAFVGPFVEIFGTGLGLWGYTNPSFLRLPLWLPVLYAFFFFSLRNASFFALHYLDKVEHFMQNKKIFSKKRMSLDI